MKKYLFAMIALIMVFSSCGRGGSSTGTSPGDITLSISSTAANPTSTSPIPVTFTFSREVTDFDSGDISVSNGTAGNFAAVSGTEYTAAITPSGDAVSITVSVAADAAIDDEGYGNTADSFSIAYDGEAPDDIKLYVSSITSTSVTFSWTEPSTEDYDHLLITWEPDGTAGVSVSSGTSEYEITGLAADTEYSFTAKSVDTLGNHSDGDSLLFPTLAGTDTVYYIDTVAELHNMRNDLDGFYILTADLDLNGYDPNGDSTGWVPVGDSGSQFSGVFIGNDHVISNLFINRSASDYQALFGYTAAGAYLININLTAVNVTGQYNVASLLARGEAKIVSGCSAAGTVTGAQRVGGLIGDVSSANIERCHADVTVTATEMYATAGGLIGSCQEGDITDCYSVGNVSGTNANCEVIGGLVGYFHNSAGGDNTISSSYATGNVTGYQYTGGLIGRCSQNISNCYATGDVSPVGTISLNSGGLVGYFAAMDDTKEMSGSYASGKVTGRSYIGGLIGFATLGKISYCYETGNVEGTYGYLGGLIGYVRGIRAECCYASGTVTKTGTGNGTYYGGFAGYFMEGSGGTASMSNCYATGAVTVEDTGDYTGGLVGGFFTATVSNCYASGKVTPESGGSYSGGLTGSSTDSTISNCFYDTTTTEMTDDIGNGSPKTTAEMQVAETFTDPDDDPSTADGWDFYGETANGSDDIWSISASINNGYPYLTGLQPE